MRLQYNAPVILTYTLLALGALVLGIYTNGYTTAMFFSSHGGNLADPLFYLRLFGHVLGHASLDHYINNFLMILLIGPILEEKYGSAVMFVMIVMTALATSILNLVLFGTGLLGASGVLFMLIVLASFANTQTGSIPITFILVAVLFIGREVVGSMILDDNISQGAHIVGGLCGAGFGFLTEKKKDVHSHKVHHTAKTGVTKTH